LPKPGLKKNCCRACRSVGDGGSSPQHAAAFAAIIVIVIVEKKGGGGTAAVAAAQLPLLQKQKENTWGT
jgi:hypothetical protein